MTTSEIVASLKLGYENERRGMNLGRAYATMRTYTSTMRQDRKHAIFLRLVRDSGSKVDFLEFCSKALDVPYCAQLTMKL